VSKWRWPTWAILGWIAVAIVVVVALASSMEAYDAGYRTGQLSWVFILGMVVLVVVWQKTKAKTTALCPRCANVVQLASPVCTRCGYSAVYQAPAQFGTCPRCAYAVPITAPACPRCAYVPGTPPYPPAPPQA
jgi:hypothetical protein